MKSWNTYDVWAKIPGGSWKHLGNESATSQAHAIRQFKPDFPKGTTFKARAWAKSRTNGKRKKKKTVTKRLGAALTRFLKKQNPGKMKGVTKVRVRKIGRAHV